MADSIRFVGQPEKESHWQQFHRLVPCINKSGSTIPAHGVVMFDSSESAELEIDEDDAELDWKVRVPVRKFNYANIGQFNPRKLFINSIQECADDKPFEAFWNQPCVALVDGNYSPGTFVGPVDGQFYLKDEGGTHEVLKTLTDTEPVTGKYLAWVMPLPVEIGVFRTGSGGIAGRNTGTGVFGSAVLDRYRIEKTGSTSYKYTQISGVTERVYNDVIGSIGANRFLWTMRLAGIMIPFKEDCSG